MAMDVHYRFSYKKKKVIQIYRFRAYIHKKKVFPEESFIKQLKTDMLLAKKKTFSPTSGKLIFKKIKNNMEVQETQILYELRSLQI